MKGVFADTFFLLGLANPLDEAHLRCVAFSKEHRGRLLTTGWVLAEVGDALAAPASRARAARFIEAILRAPQFQIVPPTQTQLERGLTFFARRPDKSWSLTDCISFVVMEEEGLAEAATADHHFEQAGFRVLLK
jgi:predicted nucleic acid-binding protein